MKRMTLIVSICAAVVLMGTALVLSTARRSRGVAAALGLSVAAVAMLSLGGQLYGAEQMYTLPRLTGSSDVPSKDKSGG